MAGPEDYVDAPEDSVRAKLERQRQGKSKYGAIPEAVKKDPVGTVGLLAAAFGAPEFQSGTKAVRSVVDTGEKAGSLASKLARIGQPNDASTQVAQGASVLKEGLNEAKDAGERKAMQNKLPKSAAGSVVKSGTYKGKSNALGHGGRAQQLKDQGVPGGVIGKLARKAQAAPGQKNYHGGTPGASSGALIAQGFDTGAPQRSSNMAAASSSAIVPSATPGAPGPNNLVSSASLNQENDGGLARADATLQREMNKPGTLGGPNMITGGSNTLRPMGTGGGSGVLARLSGAKRGGVVKAKAKTAPAKAAPGKAAATPQAAQALMQAMSLQRGMHAAAARGAVPGGGQPMQRGLPPGEPPLPMKAGGMVTMPKGRSSGQMIYAGLHGGDNPRGGKGA